MFKNVSFVLTDTWIEALEKYAKVNGFKNVEDVAQHAVMVFLKVRGYLS